MATRKTSTKAATSSRSRARTTTDSSPKNVVAFPPPPPLAGFAIGDGLSNVVTGMNMMTGRRGGDVWTFNPLTDPELLDMYRGSWMAAKAVDIIAEDMCREWRAWQMESDDIETIEAAEEEFDIPGKVQQAIAWGRMLGGGALVLGFGGNARAPINIDRLGVGALKYVQAFPKTQISAVGPINYDPGAPNFGMPETFQLNSTGNSGGVDVHWSRVILFHGKPYADPFSEGDCWSDSVLQGLNEALVSANIAASSAAQLVEEAKIDVIKMDDLASFLGNVEAERKLMERLRLIQLGKSSFSTLLMGGRESMETKSQNFGSLDDLLMSLMQIASGATDIPATRFLAQSPKGMNATGEMDLRNYASLIRSKQRRLTMGTQLKRLDRILLRHAFGDEPKGWWYDWRSIWEMSPKEKAETNKTNADADTAYVNSSLIPIDALAAASANRMVESGLYPGLDEKMSAIDRRMKEAEAEDDPFGTKARESAEEAARNAPPVAGGPGPAKAKPRATKRGKRK